MLKVYYWCDGTWCFIEELSGFSHKSDDYSVIEVAEELDYQDIDTIILKICYFAK